MTTTRVSIRGTVGGPIWMPRTYSAKQFSVDDWDFNYSDGSRPTIRGMVLKVTNDGDFQSCSIVDATVKFKRTKTLLNGTTITRTREMDIRKFKSVDDCVYELDSEEYWMGVDAMNAEFVEEWES